LSYSLFSAFLRAVFPEPDNVACLVERGCCQTYHSLRGIHFAGLEIEAIEFQEENTDHETSSLIAIDKGMVADNARRVEGGHFDNAGRTSVSIVLAGPCESGLQQPLIPNA